MHEAFLEMIKKQVASDVDEHMHQHSVMRLGYFIEALKKIPSDTLVIFDFCNFSPTTLDSYRGYYDHLAFDYEQDVTKEVKDILPICEEAMGKTYEGWKGGEFIMGQETPLWVSRRGESGNTAIVGIWHLPHVAVIMTKFVD